jgi:dihydroneopterin aldolase
MFDQPPYHNLIETVAEKIAAKILHNHPKVEAVHVAIKKPHVAINPGPVDSLGIEIVRYRKGGAGAGGGGGRRYI